MFTHLSYVWLVDAARVVADSAHTKNASSSPMQRVGSVVFACMHPSYADCGAAHLASIARSAVSRRLWHSRIAALAAAHASLRPPASLRHCVSMSISASHGSTSSPMRAMRRSNSGVSEWIVVTVACELCEGARRPDVQAVREKQGGGGATEGAVLFAPRRHGRRCPLRRSAIRRRP
jgi:hypothetical protein